MQKYVKVNNYRTGEIISKVITDFYITLKPENVLFIRTPTTGGWLDSLMKGKENITRILYETHKTKTSFVNKETIKLSRNEFQDFFKKVNKKFDLICMDPFHEYNYCIEDFEACLSVLSETGIIISHDCFPSNKMVASPEYTKGDWTGETYVAIIHFALENPDLFYGILKIDTGIGIISKKALEGIENKLDISKQKEFVERYQNSEDIYAYFIKHCKEIMNIIQK